MLVQDTKQLLADPASNDAAVQRLHDELTETYKQQLQRLVATARNTLEPGAEGDSVAVADSAAAGAAEGDVGGGDDAPVVQLHRIVIEETDGDDSEEGEVCESQPDRQDSGSRGSNGSNDSSSSDSEEEEVMLTVRPAVRSQTPAAVQQQQPAAAAAPAAAALASGARIKLAQQQQQRVLTAPKSASEFQTTARSLFTAAPAAAAGSNAPQQRQQQQQLGSYVRMLPPSQYASVFKDGLTVEHLKLLLQGLGQVSADGDVGFAEQGLVALAKVPRFGIVYAMVDRGSKGVVGEVVGRLEAAGREVGGLRNKYRV
jgi:hypothetical protein